jgi:DNA (cytosine-5)-methyltransferase 1
VPEGKLDLLMASPTCTYHSRARGGKPINDQGRMDPWAIIHWCTELRVKRLLVENVPEFVDWGPIDLRTGRPIKRRKGEYFHAWIAALKAAGFKLDWHVLNAADYGDATTRERFFLIARSDARRLTWPEPTHSKTGDADLLGPRQKWRAAREIIDWSIEGRSIFNRKRPLSPKTLARIYAGAVKFRWPEPFLVILRNHMDAQSIDGPLPTLCAGGAHVGLAEPFLLNRHGDNGSTRAHRLGDFIPAADCRGAGYLEPFVANLAHTGSDGSRCKAIGDPLQTLHAGGGSHGLVEPFVLSQHAGGAPRSVTAPIPGLTAGGAHALIAPYYGSGSGETCGSIAAPLPTVTTKARFGLVMPITHGDERGRCRSLEEPLPTVTGAHRGELACIVAAFGERPGQGPRIHSIDEPTPTICASGRVQLAKAIGTAPAYDIRFRMLDPKELARAMGFDHADAAYEFRGNKTEITKQIGNAVPVNLATALVWALMRD